VAIKDLKGRGVATPSLAQLSDIGLRITRQLHQLEAGRDYTIIQVAPK